MADKTGIEWTESTWNPLTGCTQVSPGCAYCYAKTLSRRLHAMGNSRYKNGFNLTLHPDLLELPLKWKKPRMIFVNSMSDLFHKDVPLEYIQNVFEIMNKASHHTFQVLTKRHERLAEIAEAGYVSWTDNIWQGVSIENNRFALRADYLRKVPASVRFLSCEPLLTALPDLDLTGISWVIAGGESGIKHRPVNLDHLRQVRDLCQASNVPFFLKQIGGVRPKSGGKVLDGREWQEMPRIPELSIV
ncbi:MAG TPA: phage Gp37/Gp68 family protein [Chloroflexia bacterium]|nr:phage Gp37/Gp68 family protein [Chloroflexia bacterium]